MSITTKKERKKYDWAYSLLVLYIYYFWFFSQTVFGRLWMHYAFYLLVFFVFLYKVIKQGLSFDKLSVLWIPFYLYCILGYLFVQNNVERSINWIIALFIVLVAESNLSSRINFRILYWMGLYAVLGIATQLFFPSFYNSEIAPLFIKDQILTWTEVYYGYAGFTYQLAATAEMLVIGEVIALFMWDIIGLTKSKFSQILVVITFFVCVFLTGKRMNILIAFVLPFFVNFLSNRKIGSRAVIVLLLLISGFSIITFFQNNINELLDISFFSRTATTYNDYRMGYSIAGGRDELWAKAIELFKQEPLFGIGVGNYLHKSGFSQLPHNAYLQVLCEQGIIGLMMFLLPLLYCFVATVKMLNKTPTQNVSKPLLVSLAIQLVYIMEGFTENVNTNLSGFLLYAVAIAILHDCKKMGKRQAL